jgi:uncharacterized protein with HEPN domain
MSNSTIDLLKHILGEINFITEEIRDLEFYEFIENEKDKRAYSRSLEIIGEAIKNLPDELRDQYPIIDWKSAAGLRDRLVHGYFAVDYEIIWKVITLDIPILKRQIEIMIANIDEQ